MGIENFDLKKFREEFLQSDGWQVSDCYKSYDDKFLRKDAQDAYEGAKWAWAEQQKKIDAIVSIVREADLSDGNSSVAIVHDEIMDLLK